MPRVSLAFFMFAALSGCIGLGWGVYMGVTQDHTSYSAHAHLNLLGWVTPALMGGFYALAKDRVDGPMPWVNLSLSMLGVVAMIPALALKITGSQAGWLEPAIGIGALANWASMITFAVIVGLAMFSKGVRPTSPQAA